ncbi:hypothetical protein CAPTEDRAFT_200538 [Capitella teleta]|uniref:F-box domain-containing protein n=1 Tax=Capitella teleta TaxID=283909 RepID=R7TFN2_CAPTE|nr:hypothetical protein CAPTEDRAFT_200538 [Capitella teleta]|eukprot:ELT89851.1 hypothetical protein CAPTEDRAFT_200538 [Capitella teleta]
MCKVYVTISMYRYILCRELLLSIFQYSASKWGPVPIICRACQVCRLWRDVAHDPSLWRQLDLSSGWIRKNVLGLMSLRMSGRFQVVRSLNLTAWWGLLDHHLEVVLAACPNLTHLNVSHCQALTDSGISALASSASTLTHLDMTHMAPLATSIPSMRQLIVKKGPHLQRLNISSNVFTHKFSNILLLITVHCSGLKALLMNDIHVAGSVKVPLDILSMQSSICGLEELNIEGTPFIALSAQFEEGPGFPALRSYSAHAHNSNQDQEDQLFIERYSSHVSS